MDTTENFSFGVVILAAGASSRMGQSKLLLPWGSSTVIGHLLEQWRVLGAKLALAVTAPNAKSLLGKLAANKEMTVRVIINPAPELGMFSSIQTAARAVDAALPLTHWVLSLGDQPHVRVQTLRALINFTATRLDKICQPARAGRGRHPIIFPAAIFRQLGNASESTLKEFLATRASQIARCELDDPGLDLDMDTPEDYERALKLGVEKL